MTPRVKGLLSIAASTACFATMSVLAKIAVSSALQGAPAPIAALTASPVSAGEVLLYRNLLGWLGLMAAARLLGARGTQERPGLLILRGVLGGLAVLAFFYAFAHTDLAKAALIGYAYPVFALLVARVAYGERVRPRAGVLMGIALLGVALILKPDPAQPFNLGDASALLAAIFSGAAIATLRQLRRSEATLTVVLHFTFWGTVVSLPAVAITGLSAPDAPHLVLLVAIAAVAAVGQLLLTEGYRYCDTAEGGTISLLNSVFTVAFGLALLGETLRWTTWVGGALTLGTCLFLIAPRDRKAKAG
jgi:drug/metabolite transporter (DMT)-like permease